MTRLSVLLLGILAFCGLNVYCFSAHFSPNIVQPVIPPPVSQLQPTKLQTMQLELDKILSIENIEFRTASADIASKSVPLIDKLAKLLVQDPTIHVQISGHTDSMGKSEMNKTLSEDRARSVRGALLRRNVKPEQVTAVGFGSDKPIADNATAEGRRKNRRIEFNVMKGGVQ